MVKRIIISIIVLLSIFGLYSIISPSANAQSKKEAVEGEILVKFKEGLNANEMAAIHRKLGGKVKDTIPGIDVQVIEVNRGMGEMVSAYAREGKIEYAEPNYVAELLEVTPLHPSDVEYQADKQWALHNFGQVFDSERNLAGLNDKDIDAPEAWSVTQGSPDIYIAILDSGIDTDHPDLLTKLMLEDPKRTKDFTGTGIEDYRGHGTHVAGIAAAETNNNGMGVAGTGFNSGLMIGKVCIDDGTCSYSAITNGIIWAADNNAKVISISLGSPYKSRTLESAVNYAFNSNVVIVAAAGNSSNSSPTYPAYYTNVIAVAATDSRDVKASFSSYGKWVDVAAPGVEVFSTFPNHTFGLENPDQNRDKTYGYGSGTSMSTPVVAGIAGLVWSTGLSGDSNVKVRAQIEKNADPIVGTGRYWKWGRVNAYKAVTIAK